MEETGVKRKFAVILAADVAGYSRLMGADEEATLKTLGAYREIIDATIAGHDGRVFATAGDSVVAEFASAVEAVRAAISIQQELAVSNAGLADERKMHLRIGINLGDVMVEGDNLLGDGVNVAARLEGLADPGGICVSDMVYQSVEAKLDLAFEDLGAQSVKNIAKPVRSWRIVPGSAASAASSRPPSRSQVLPRLGVLVFVAIAVAVLGITGAAIWNYYLPGPAPPDEAAPETGMALPLPDKPSIAVLPFTNMTGDPEQEYFSDGISEDIITDLSKVSGLFVIARNSSFKFKGKSVDIREVARDLGVRYVLEGSVRKAGNKVRVTAQLIDASTGGHLWAERYDRDLKDIFALQDEIAEKIVEALEVKLTEDEQQRVARRYTENLKAYDLFLRGRAIGLRLTKERNFQARSIFERAIELDPKFAKAYAELSYMRFLEWEWQLGEGSEPLDRAFELAQRAVALDDSLAEGHLWLGWIYNWKKQHEQAITEAKRAITLDPSYADGHAMLGEILNYAGRPEEGIGFIKKAMRLNPRYPGWYLFELGHSYYLMGQNEEAIAAMKRSVTLNPDFLPAHRWLAAIYSDLGRSAEARAEAAEILRISPKASLALWRQRLPYKDSAVLARFIDGLRKAGLPETSKAAAP